MGGLQVVGTVVLVLGTDEGVVEVEELFELRDHPGEGDVGELLVFVAAANVGVYAGEPNLAEDLLEGEGVSCAGEGCRDWGRVIRGEEEGGRGGDLRSCYPGAFPR